MSEAISAAVMVFDFVKAHPELMAMLMDIIGGKKLTADEVTQALRAALVAASDFEMKRELG